MLADSNIWLALAVETHQHHDAVEAWFNEQSAARAVAFCRATQTSVLRLMTTKAVMNGYGGWPLTNDEAWSVYEAFIGDSRTVYLHEPAGLDDHWKRLGARATNSPNLWMDAYLASFAITCGCAFVTLDTAFQQFEGLNLVILSNRKT